MDEDSRLGNRHIFSQGDTWHLGRGVHVLQLFSNTCIIETDEGVVLFDVGLPFAGPRIVEELRSFTEEPVRYIVYGHGHADHAFGTRSILEDADARGHPRPVIVAHENVVRRFDRYREMLPYHEHINRIQFDITEGIPAFVRDYIYPDETFTDEMAFVLGGTTFELRHAMGETDDHTLMWIPERNTICVSDLWVWSCPNIGNPFKVQRYEVEWAEALEAVRSLGPELMLPGHGDVIEGPERIGDACLTVARALRFLHEQVVEMLNKGLWQEDILNSFEWPREFAGSPYLEPIYGHPYFVVQAILRRYHGWYDGNPSHLFPSPSGDVAREVTALIGEPGRLLERARELVDRGQKQLALHLLDFVIDGGARLSGEALRLKAEALEGLAADERSLIARNILLCGAREARKRMGERPH